MGWHAGMLVARCSWPALAAALGSAVRLDVGGELAKDAVLEPDESAGGEHGGRAYIYEPGFELSADGDLVVTLSRALGTLVIGCGAETVSGSYWLFAAERGELLRAYWACAMELDAPLDEGTWPGAPAIEIDDLDASGLHQVLARGGFDWVAFADRAAMVRVKLPADHALGRGPIASRIDAHRTAHKLAEQPSPMLVMRMTDKPSWWSRLRNWFTSP